MVPRQESVNSAMSLVTDLITSIIPGRFAVIAHSGVTLIRPAGSQNSEGTLITELPKYIYRVPLSMESNKKYIIIESNIFINED